MKKAPKIVPLALIVAALLTSSCGCNSEHINTNPSDQTKESSSVVETGNTHIESVDTSVTTIKLARNTDEVSSNQNNSESIQTKQYQYFYRAIEENPYDKWLKNELEKGERAEKTIYAEYLAFWKDELAFTIESSEVIFDDRDQYGQWKSDIQQWLVISQDILKNEMNMMNYSLGQLEVIIPYCEMVRQKAIDAKRFIYYYQIYNTLTPYTNIEINWCSK